jgi:hypothetical protein
MKTYGGVDILIQVYFTSAVVGSEWSVSCPGHFTPTEINRVTHLIGGWVGPEISLDYMKRRKSYPYRVSNSDPSVVQPVASRYNNCAIWDERKKERKRKKER